MRFVNKRAVCYGGRTGYNVTMKTRLYHCVIIMASLVVRDGFTVRSVVGGFGGRIECERDG